MYDAAISISNFGTKVLCLDINIFMFGPITFVHEHFMF